MIRPQDIRVENPRLQTPVSLILDDSSPGEPIYSEFVDDFARLVEETGIKGKFTVMPYTFPETLDQALKGDRPKYIQRLVEKIRNRIAPNFDITPEILTHNPVVDLGTGGLVYPAVAEHTWSQTQKTETLTPYIARALQILKDAGLEATGITSPANFGKEVEEEYARAVLQAQQQVNGRSLTWYFLHTDTQSQPIIPRLTLVDKAQSRAVVSIVSGYGDYVIDPTLAGKPRDEKIDRYAGQYITTDGGQGRLAELYHSDSYLIFHHHWWRMMKEGYLGFDILREIAKRLHRVFGENIQWLKVSDIALYWATSQCVEIKVGKEGAIFYLQLHSPFPCPDFTMSFQVSGSFPGLRIRKAGQELTRQEARVPLKSNTWCVKEERVYLCFDLDIETRIFVNQKGGRNGRKRLPCTKDR